jgi:hypothetical protein
MYIDLYKNNIPFTSTHSIPQAGCASIEPRENMHFVRSLRKINRTVGFYKNIET